MEERAQSEFNMAVSYLNRMNALFYIADEAAMSLDAYQWFHSLLAIERELSTEMKDPELTNFENTIKKIAPEVTYWVENKNKGLVTTIDAELYENLHKLEIDLRKILKGAGPPTKDDGGRDERAEIMKVTKQDFYMDGFVKAALDTAKKTIEKDWDMVFCVDGSEGSGKSVLAMQLAYYCDPTLDNTRVVFTPQDFRKAIVGSKQYQAVIYDEAYTGLSSRATMSLINRTLISMLAEIRQRNLFVFVVMPCFFDLDKYVALWRSRGLFHVYTGKSFERGFLAFYNTDRKKDLYILGKKFYSYFKPKPNFFGRFTNHYAVDEKEYKRNKKNSLIVREKKVEEAEKKREIENEMFSRLQEMKKEVSHPLKMEILGMASATYFRKLRAYNDLKEFD